MTINEEFRLEYLLKILKEIEKNLKSGLNEVREEFTKRDVNTLQLEISSLIVSSKTKREEDERE